VAKYYNYVLAVWIRLAVPRAAPDFLEELQEYLETKYQIIELEIVEEDESDVEGELTVSSQLVLTFDESQMDGDDPTEEVIGELDTELRAFLESKYQVNHLEILDDALTSYLRFEWEEPERRKYPEPKQRDLTDDEKTQLRARIERGDADIYLLATEFGCSASQVAGIKAAIHR
jgi:transposase-like protein